MAASDVADTFFNSDDLSFADDHIGVQLRAARESRGLEISEAASALKIRPAYLQALEEADPLALPPPAYACSFARSYASYLGLDPDEIASGVRLDCRFRENRKPELIEEQTPPERRVPKGVAGAVAVLALAAIALTWYGYNAPANSSDQETPPVPAALAEWSFNEAPAEADESIWDGMAGEAEESAANAAETDSE